MGPLCWHGSTDLQLLSRHGYVDGNQGTHPNATHCCSFQERSVICSGSAVSYMRSRMPQNLVCYSAFRISMPSFAQL